MEWNGMEWNSMEWIGMEVNGMEWKSMEWNGSQWNGMEVNGMDWKSMEWNGMEWNGMEWNGSQWNGSQCTFDWDGVQRRTRRGESSCDARPGIADVMESHGMEQIITSSSRMECEWNPTQSNAAERAGARGAS